MTLSLTFTGQELHLPEGTHHSMGTCVVDGQTVEVHLQDVPEASVSVIVKTLSTSIDSQRCGVRRAVKDTLLAALHSAPQPQTAPKTA